MHRKVESFNIVIWDGWWHGSKRRDIELSIDLAQWQNKHVKTEI